MKRSNAKERKVFLNKTRHCEGGTTVAISLGTVVLFETAKEHRGSQRKCRVTQSFLKRNAKVAKKARSFAKDKKNGVIARRNDVAISLGIVF